MKEREKCDKIGKTSNNRKWNSNSTVILTVGGTFLATSGLSASSSLLSSLEAAVKTNSKLTLSQQ